MADGTRHVVGTNGQERARNRPRFSTLTERARSTLGAADTRQPVGGDILFGADAIAAFLFGAKTYRRRVYNLIDKQALPVFRMGATVCARRSVLLAFIADQERRDMRG